MKNKQVFNWKIMVIFCALLFASCTKADYPPCPNGGRLNGQFCEKSVPGLNQCPHPWGGADTSAINPCYRGTISVGRGLCRFYTPILGFCTSIPVRNTYDCANDGIKYYDYIPTCYKIDKSDPCPNGGLLNAAGNMCTIAPVVNGTCGSSNGVLLTSEPTANFCTAGSFSGLTSSVNPWTWSCLGSGGGTTASCSTLSTATSCGSAVTQTFPTTTPPTTNLCAVGYVPGDISTPILLSNYSFWWSCWKGTKATRTFCTSVPAPVNGECGGCTTNPQGSCKYWIMTPPTPNYMTVGSMCNVTNDSPPIALRIQIESDPSLTWQCTGINGGTSATCKKYVASFGLSLDAVNGTTIKDTIDPTITATNESKKIQVASGTALSLTATAATGTNLDIWKGDGTCSGKASSTCSFTINKNTTVGTSVLTSVCTDNCANTSCGQSCTKTDCTNDATGGTKDCNNIDVINWREVTP